MDYHVERLAQGALFTISRPTHLNALNREIWQGLESCLDELEAQGGRCLLITGEGPRAFSAGSDLKDDVLVHWDQQSAKSDKIRNLLLRLSRSCVYSLALVNGMAHGGGLELALACTQRMTVASAQFSMPEIRLGVIPSYGGTQFLPAVVGRARAAELMLTGRPLSAMQALEWGLVSHVFDDIPEMKSQALTLTTEVAGHSAEGCAAILRCLADAGAVPTQASMDIESRELARVLQGQAAKDGIRAFLNRRQPRV